MSNVLDRFIGQRKRERQAGSQTHWQRYRDLLEKFANGSEVDATEADETIAQAGKTEAELQADVEVFQKRLAAAAAIASGATAQSDAQAAEQTILQMEWQLLDLQRKLGPQIDAARQKRAHCETLLFQQRYAQDYLRSNVLDPSVSQRERVLNTEHSQLTAQASELRKRIKSCNIDYRRAIVASLEQKQTLVNYVTRADTELENARATLAAAQNQVEPWVNELQQIDRRLSEIAGELQNIDSEKLKP